MFHATRTWFSVGLLLFVSACSRPSLFKTADNKPTDKADAPFDPPNTYPEWAFDAPQYVKPAQELNPEPKAKPGDPLHYFTKEKVVMIRQPAGYTPEEIPRVAVWWSDNNGFRWQKAGFFGRQQTYFAFEAQEDGDYGIRFVGPNQEQAMQATAFPERVYHVNTTLPEVEVAIEPEQTWYNVGQSVSVSWRADDYHLIELPVTVTAMLDFTADESKPIEIQKGLAREGSITYQIPPESLSHELRFRVDALDRANNLGIAYSYALQIVSEPVDQSAPRPKKPAPGEVISLKRSKAVTDHGRAVAAASGQSAEPWSGVVAANPHAQKTTTEDLSEENSPVSNDRPTGAAPIKSGAVTVSAKSNAEESPRANEVEDVQLADAAALDSERVAIQPIGQSESTDSKPVGEPISVKSEPGDEAIVSLILRAASRGDITQGNGLLVPLPATVDCDGVDLQAEVAHPWRRLTSALETPLKSIWALPNADFVQKNPALKNLFLAGVQVFSPLGEPAQEASHVALDTRAE